MIEMQKVSGGLDLGGPDDGAEEGALDGAAVRIPVGYNLKNGPNDSDLVALIRGIQAGKTWEQVKADEGARIQPAALERWKDHILAQAGQAGNVPVLPPNHPSLVKRAQPVAPAAPAPGAAKKPAAKKPAAKRARRSP